MTQERGHARVNKQEERGGTHGQDLNKKVSPGGSEESLGCLPEMEDLNAWPPYPFSRELQSHRLEEQTLG